MNAQTPAPASGPSADRIPDRIRAKSSPRPGTWISAVIVVLLVLGLINFLVSNESSTGGAPSPPTSSM